MVVVLCGLVNNADEEMGVIGIGGTITPVHSPDTPYNVRAPGG
jgi:hypothetical protein